MAHFFLSWVLIRESEQAAENKRQLAAREKILTVLKSAQKTLYYSSIKKYFELFIVDHLKGLTITNFRS